MQLPRWIVKVIDPVTVYMQDSSPRLKGPMFRGGAVFGPGVPGGARQATPEELDEMRARACAVPRSQVWKVGSLASATGLTVRTLHHYDHIALVSPSGRTPSGHRLYEESDVRRLYQVLALRQLGLPLDKIREVMAGQASVAKVLAVHHRFLTAQLASVRVLRARHGALASTMSQSATPEDFLELIQKVIAMDETVTKYLTEDQLADLADRREQLGEDAIAQTQAGWAELLPKVGRALESGIDPSSAEAQVMAARWMELLEQFHGGDAGLRDNLYRMQADNSEQIEQQHGGPSPAQLDFIKAANAALGSHLAWGRATRAHAPTSDQPQGRRSP